MTVFVELSVMDDVHLKNNPLFFPIRDKVQTFRDGKDLTDKVDFIVCLGGDGTLLYASSLFQVCCFVFLVINLMIISIQIFLMDQFIVINCLKFGILNLDFEFRKVYRQ